MKPSRGDLAALAALAALFGARFQAPLLGGDLYLRDAGFFFVPLRTVLSRLLRAGELPLWNDAMSNGRALAADPNAAAFWPLSPLHLVLSPTGVAMASAAASVALVYAALRLLRLPPLSAAPGAAVVLLSGVFQSLPVYFVTLAAAGPLALALGALGGLEPERGWARRASLAGLGLALSLLAGEPAVAAMGALLAAGLTAVAALGTRRERVARLRALGVAAGIALGVSAVQLLPAARELARSARGQEMRAEHGALFWSVRPARLLTLLEPRLTGDPAADRDEEYWGAATFDAGNPYFLDLALGVLPLLLAAAGSVDPRGRGALAVAGAGALLATGRHLPGYAALIGGVRPLTVLRYPEKWWLPVTLALAAAAAVGVERLRRADPGAVRRLRVATVALGLALLALGGLAAGAPGLLRGLLWTAGLGEGPTGADRVGALVLPGLLLGLASVAAVALVLWLRARDRVGPVPAALALLALFLVDAGRRVAGTCPTRPAGAGDDAASLVARRAAGGRFYDDGADRRDVALRRAREAGGHDTLRPETGVVSGIAYAGENDVDRMMPAASVAWSRATAALPWGALKVARLRSAGVSLVRTAEPGPDPDGVVPVGRIGADRLLALSPTRPRYTLSGEVWTVPDESTARDRMASPGWDPTRVVIVEAPGPEARRRGPAGSLRVLEDRPGRQRLAVDGPPGVALVVPRTYDPFWRATVDGRPEPIRRADGAFSAVLLPADARAIQLEYRNPLIPAGLLVSVAALAAALRLLAVAEAGPLCEDRADRADRPDWGGAE